MLKKYYLSYNGLLYNRFLVDRVVKLFSVFAWYCKYVENYHNMSYCA